MLGYNRYLDPLNPQRKKTCQTGPPLTKSSVSTHVFCEYPTHLHLLIYLNNELFPLSTILHN